MLREEVACPAATHPAAAAPSTTTSAAPPPATAVPAGTPTEVVDRFLTAEKAFDCPTAFAYLSGGIRTAAGSPAALCTMLHQHPIVSFMPSTLIDQTGSTALVRVEVSCDGQNNFEIVGTTIVPFPGIISKDHSGPGRICG